MSQVTIENPVINSPFDEPRRHFRFTEDGITEEVIEGRCIREYFVPIPRAKKKNLKQLIFDSGWGRWAFIEIIDPWDAMNTIRTFLQGENVDGVGPLFQERS